jgi:predicted RNA-binding Zn-ribbon protein involved in translation (DUF1610 family)
MVEKKKFHCNACKWKFTRNFTPTLCPYCGRASIIEEATSNAADFVREVDELGK